MIEQFTVWHPNRNSRERLKLCQTILEEYKADNIVLTLRQLFYQLIGKDLIPNTQKEYKKLSTLLTKARESGRVDWSCIEDRIRRPLEWNWFNNIQECAKEAAQGFCLQRWSTQPKYVELWCEKDALSSVLRPICDELFVTSMVNRGYSSCSAMYEARNRIERNRKHNKWRISRRVHILYLGDLDPSGEDMVRDIRDRFDMFEVEDIKVTKVAINPDQVKRWNLKHNTAKLSDSRADGFIAKFGNKSYEVDAIPPRELQKLIKRSIVKHMDMASYQRIVSVEASMRSKLIKAVKKIK